MLTVLDLFSGIGGFSLGLERTGGFKTVTFCEIDNYCQLVLRKHWPDTYIHSDIRTLGAQHFEHYRKPDVIVGGFPCQDISVAGKGVGIGGERSGLWFEMLRVIRELRPRWVLVENVANIRTKGADEVLSGLEGSGYTCWPSVVGAWAVGALHQRNRFWALAHSSDYRLEGELLEGSAYPTVPPEALLTHEICNDEEQLPEPKVVGSLTGVPNGVDRIKCLGNSVVPQIPELFGRFILSMEAAA